MKGSETTKAELEYMAAITGVSLDEIKKVLKARRYFLGWLGLKILLLISMGTIVVVDLLTDGQLSLDPALWSLLTCSLLCYIPMFSNLKVIKSFQSKVRQNLDQRHKQYYEMLTGESKR